ncbi:MAG: phosphoenolpyruvate carboxykinase (ATP), partial [Bacteroidales bacterium]
MKNIDLSKYGINDVKKVIYNPSYEELYEAELNPSLTSYEAGKKTELGAINVMTGVYTGRSPKDKYWV